MNNSRVLDLNSLTVSLQEQYTFWISQKKPQKVLRCGSRKRVPKCHSSPSPRTREMPCVFEEEEMEECEVFLKN